MMLRNTLVKWAPGILGDLLGVGRRRLRGPREMSTSLHPQATATISSRTPSPQTAWAVSPSAGSHASEHPPTPPERRLGSWLLGWVEYGVLSPALSGRASPPNH